MAQNIQTKEALSPTIKITLLNYSPARQDKYSENFMLPLMKGLLQRTLLAQAE